MLEAIAKERGTSLDKAYDEVGYELQETFGTLYGAFKEALHKPERLKKYAGDWFDAIQKVAKKEIGEKIYDFRAELTVRSMDPDGISKVKDILKKVEKEGLEVRYIAAPRYMIIMTTKDPKKAEKDMQEKLAKLSSSAKDVEVSFKML